MGGLIFSCITKATFGFLCGRFTDDSKASWPLGYDCCGIVIKTF